MLNHLVWSHPVLVHYSSGPVPGNNQTDIVLFLSITLFCYQLLSRFTSPVLCTPPSTLLGKYCCGDMHLVPGNNHIHISFQILRIARAALSWPLNSLNASMYLQRASWFRVIRLGWPILRLWMPWDAEQFEFPAGRAPLWSWRPSTPTARWSFTRPPWKSVEKMKRRTFHDFMTPDAIWCNLMQSDAKMICECLLELLGFYRRAVTLPRHKPWGISRISVAGYLSDVSEKTRAGAFEGHRRRLRKPSTK